MPKKTQGYAREDEPIVPCCFAMCQRQAIMRKRTVTGWANVCAEHDIELANREAQDWLKAQGIDRQPGESMREWMGRTLVHVREKRGTRQRVKDIPTVAELLPILSEPPGRIEFADWDEAPAAESDLEPA